MVTAGVVTISLTVGTLAGYGLARSGSNLAFWLLITALIFRALPHSVLVAGYLPPFINSAEILRPFLRRRSPHLVRKPWAVIAVLVSINQPFTIWMLRSFFQNIPTELDEAARVDGCSHFEAFRRVIMPVMWPGVITTGLFSFLLAYNDFLVTSLLLDAQNQTMVPAIVGYFNRETTTTDQVEAVAAAVSITAPLFLLVMVFQRQIVSGLTAAVSRKRMSSEPLQASLSRDTDMSKTDETRRIIEGMVQALNDHRIDDIGEFFSEDFVWHGNTGCGVKRGIKEFQDNWQRPFQAAFPASVRLTRRGW